MRSVHTDAMNELLPDGNPDFPDILQAFGAARRNPATGSSTKNYAIELSIVMPCLNEADTLGICILKAQAAIHDLDVDAEIIIADN